MTNQPVLKTINEHHPKYPKLLQYVKKGHLYFDEEMFSKALKMYYRALSIFDHSAELWCYVGLAYSGMKDKDSAIGSFKHAIVLDSSYVDSYWYAAEVLSEYGHHEAAICLLNIYSELETNDQRKDEAIKWKNTLVSDSAIDETKLLFDIDDWIQGDKVAYSNAQQQYDTMSSDDEPEAMQQYNTIRNRQLNLDKDEYEICKLGTGWIESFVMGGELEKSVLVVTNKRLYQQGRAFNRDNKGLHSVRSKRVIEIDAVSGSSVIMNNPIALIGLAFMTLFLGIMLAMVVGGSIGGVIAGISLFLSVFMFIIYAVNRRQFLVIHFRGGEILLNSSWYSFDSIDTFQMKLSEAIACCKKQYTLGDSRVSET